MEIIKKVDRGGYTISFVKQDIKTSEEDLKNFYKTIAELLIERDNETLDK